MLSKNFKILTLCSLLIASNGVRALSLPSEDVCVSHHTRNYSVNNDADFLKKSCNLLLCVNDEFDHSIQALNVADLDLDRLNKSMEPGERSRILLKIYASLVKKLLNYKPANFNNEIVAQRLKLLKTQKDLRILISWFTKERGSLNFSVFAIFSCYKLELENIDNTALLKDTINCHMLSNPNYLKEFNEAQVYLQRNLDAFLKADKWNVTPKYIQKLMIDLARMREVITEIQN